MMNILIDKNISNLPQIYINNDHKTNTSLFYQFKQRKHNPTLQVCT